VRLIFVDDSGQRSPPRTGLGALIAVGGLVVPEWQLRPLAASIAQIRREIGMPEGEELKWKSPKGSFLASASGETIRRLREDMLAAAIEHKARSIVVILDHSAAYTSLSKPEAGREILKNSFQNDG
jgi:hypothetical protein